MAHFEKRGDYSYRIIVDVGFGPNGKRIRRKKTITIPEQLKNGRKKEINAWLDHQKAQFVTEVRAGEYIEPEKMTFSAFVEVWRDKYACYPNNLAPSTLNAYENHLKNHIKPVFGHKQLDHIKPMHIVTFFKDLEKPDSRKDGKGALASGTIEVIYRTIRNVFNRAKEWSVIPKNPMENVKKPAVEYKKMDFYDEIEAAQVIEGLASEPRMWRLLILGAMVGGLRRGELLALEWTDVDFNERTLYIQKNIPLARKDEVYEKIPKTKSSNAKVEMPKWYMKELNLWHQEWLEEKDNVKDLWKGEDREYIFHGGYGRPLYYTYPSEWWKEFVERQEGLKYITFHSLRHSCATLLLEDNVPLKKIQERLRHSKFQTTSDLYTHVTKKGKTETAASFDKFDPSSKK